MRIIKIVQDYAMSDMIVTTNTYQPGSLTLGGGGGGGGGGTV
jgi:hypothetical protein